MRNTLNNEGLTFKEWVCAAGLAVFDGCGNVRPYSSSQTYTQCYCLGNAGSSDERFFDYAPRFKKVRRSSTFYPRSLREAWKAGEDPTERRYAKQVK